MVFHSSLKNKLAETLVVSKIATAIVLTLISSALNPFTRAVA